MDNTTTTDRWWGTFELPEGRPLLWRVGTLAVALESRDTEWLLRFQYDEPTDTEQDRVVVAADATGWSAGEVERFASGSPCRSVRISPGLADRSVVSRPDVPFRLLPGESISIFVGTPLWFRIEHPEKGICVREIPLSRPSDTWFGPSTREGELCYATRTQARLRESEVPVRPYRAVTPVELTNGGTDAMWLERINLPVPILSAYREETGNIWTNALALERRDDRELAELKILPGPPAAIPRARLLCNPRVAAGRKVLRTLSSLLG